MSKGVVIAGWDDCPWWSEEAKSDQLKATPPHMRDAVSKGLPTIGIGNVYPVQWDDITCDPFEIPAHFRRWYALDVGWNFTAALWGAIDPNTKDIFIYKEYKAEKKEPVIHASAIMGADPWIPGVIDPGANARSSQDGRQLMRTYTLAGLKLREAKNNVESGIEIVWEALSTGKCKIFSNLFQLRQEMITYARDTDGRIIKRNDHLCDAMRYLLTSTQIATSSLKAKQLGYSTARTFPF